MGATCAPQGDEEEQEECNMEVEIDQTSGKEAPEENEDVDVEKCIIEADGDEVIVEADGDEVIEEVASEQIEVLEQGDCKEDETMKKLAQVIDEYKAENEALKKQLEEYNTVEDENAAEESVVKASQNEEVIRELAEMKALIEAKDEMLVRGRLEAALLSKATVMLSDHATTELCVNGNLKHVHKTGFSKSRKLQWVEIYKSKGEEQSNDYLAGFVILTYADSRDAPIVNKSEILEVVTGDTRKAEFIFTLKVLVQGLTKDLVFACETADERDEWIRIIAAALAEVKEIYNRMHDEFILKIKFEGEKLGFRVKENVIVGEKCEKKTDAPVEQGLFIKMMKEMEVAEKVIKKGAEKVVDEVEALGGKESADESKQEKDEPCKLTVSDIMDESLYTVGLQLNYAVCSINDIVLPGKSYTEQLDLLESTPKPFIVTFSGKNFMKNDNVRKQGYASILNELVDDDDNPVKKAFNELIKGTRFEEELIASDNQTATISALLANQRRLLALLQNL